MPSCDCVQHLQSAQNDTHITRVAKKRMTITPRFVIWNNHSYCRTNGRRYLPRQVRAKSVLCETHLCLVLFFRESTELSPHTKMRSPCRCIVILFGFVYLLITWKLEIFATGNITEPYIAPPRDFFLLLLVFLSHYRSAHPEHSIFYELLRRRFLYNPCSCNYNRCSTNLCPPEHNSLALSPHPLFLIQNHFGSRNNSSATFV